ncbi:molybdopterin-binding protein, partial [Parolsenella catena]|uniref:molybdopterin-binding protein n=1 Tax=Parolsenella catena TaxID=2003188 RepID=UPI002FE108AA
MGHHHKQSGALGGAAGVQAYTAAVITVSDRCSAGRRDDATGPAVAELLAREGFEVCSTAIVADDVDAIGAAIQDAAAADVAMCVTAGGTGLSPR